MLAYHSTHAAPDLEASHITVIAIHSRLAVRRALYSHRVGRNEISHSARCERVVLRSVDLTYS